MFDYQFSKVNFCGPFKFNVEIAAEGSQCSKKGH